MNNPAKKSIVTKVPESTTNVSLVLATNFILKDPSYDVYYINH